jgi:hypothetical protein
VHAAQATRADVCFVRSFAHRNIHLIHTEQRDLRSA